MKNDETNVLPREIDGSLTSDDSGAPISRGEPAKGAFICWFSFSRGVPGGS